MQAYATSERMPAGDQLRTLDRKPPVSIREASTLGDAAPALMDEVLRRLADLVVDRLMERTAADTSDHLGKWLDARGAAAYLGIHRDTLRKFAAQRAIPSHQDGPRCKLYFHRGELDEWRRSPRRTGAAAARLRAVS